MMECIEEVGRKVVGRGCVFFCFCCFWRLVCKKCVLWIPLVLCALGFFLNFSCAGLLFQLLCNLVDHFGHFGEGTQLRQ